MSATTNHDRHKHCIGTVQCHSSDSLMGYHLWVLCEIFNYETVTHAHPFNGPLSTTTWVSRYQKGKTNLDFTEARDGE